MIRNKYKNYIFIIMILVSLGSFFVVLLKNNNMYSNFLCILPVINMFFSMVYICIFNKRNINIGSLIIHVSFFIRLTISPLLIVMGDYFERAGIALNYDKAIMYMVYEYALVMFTMIFWEKKFKKTRQIQSFSIDNISFNKNTKIIIMILTLISTAVIVRYPSILNYFRIGFFDDTETNNWYINYYKAFNEIPSTIFYLTTWTLVLLKYIYVLGIIMFLKKSKLKGKILYSILIVGISLIINTSTLSDSLYFAIIYFLLLMELYKEKYKTFIKMLAISLIFFVGFGLFYMSVMRHNNEDIYFTLSKTSMAYFSGINNVARALEIENYDTFEIMKGDFLRSIPLLKGFFVDLTRTDTVFNQYIGDKYESQITPTLGQSYLYFGTILSPLLSCIFTMSTVILEHKISMEEKLDKRFLLYLLIIRCACVPVMYNGYIFLIGIFNAWVPLKILFWFNNKGNKEDKNENVNIL